MTPPQSDYRRAVINPREGIYQVRIGRRFWFVKSPRWPALYSERHGRQVRVLFRLGGWRFGFRWIA